MRQSTAGEAFDSGSTKSKAARSVAASCFTAEVKGILVGRCPTHALRKRELQEGVSGIRGGVDRPPREVREIRRRVGHPLPNGHHLRRQSEALLQVRTVTRRDE